jgi:hypothetical protein
LGGKSNAARDDPLPIEFEKVQFTAISAILGAGLGGVPSQLTLPSHQAIELPSLGWGHLHDLTSHQVR